MHSVVTRMEVGGFLAPESYAPGERVVVNSWLVRHPEATILVDTGIAENLPPNDVQELKFLRTPIVDALSGLGVQPDEIDVVINCHLHADHAGGNVCFPGSKILIQPAEVVAASEPEYSVPEALNLAGGNYRERAGEYEPFPGVRIVPTPGHSPGHQSVAIETSAGLLLLAGQCYRDASSFARAVTAYRLAQSGYAEAPPTPEWLPKLLAMEPYRVVFGHDHAIWQPSET